MKYLISFVLFCLLVVVAKDACTDTIYLKSGKEHKGTVINQNESGVLFLIGDKEEGVEILFANDEVLRIDKAGADQIIKVPLTEGPEITIPRPRISQGPLFTNLTQKVVFDKNIPFGLNQTK